MCKLFFRFFSFHKLITLFLKSLMDCEEVKISLNTMLLGKDVIQAERRQLSQILYLIESLDQEEWKKENIAKTCLAMMRVLQ